MTSQAATLQTVVGSPNGNGFTLWGDFYPGWATSTLVQHIGGRYISYNVHQALVSASDVTTLPTDSLQYNNLSGRTETTTWPGGNFGTLAGNYILYKSGADVRVIDASNPGPAGNITALYPQTLITSADFGGRSISAYSAAIDPTDPTKLWVLAELNRQTGENSPSYGLISVTSSLVKVAAGPVWRVPSHGGRGVGERGGGLSARREQRRPLRPHVGQAHAADGPVPPLLDDRGRVDERASAAPSP